MAIEIVDLPSYKMVVFHSFLYVYQRVPWFPTWMVFSPNFPGLGIESSRMSGTGRCGKSYRCSWRRFAAGVFWSDFMVLFDDLWQFMMVRWWFMAIYDGLMMIYGNLWWFDDDLCQFMMVWWWFMAIYDGLMMIYGNLWWFDDDLWQFMMVWWWFMAIYDGLMMIYDCLWWFDDDLYDCLWWFFAYEDFTQRCWLR